MKNSPSLNCSPDSADSPSLSSVKDSAALESAKLKSGPTSSAPTGIPAFQTSEIARLPISQNGFLTRAGRLMSLRVAFRASLQALSENGLALPMPGGSGVTQSASVASYDPATRCLRTRQLCLLSNPGEPSTELCQDWPRSGMIVCGSLYPLPSLVPVICVGESVSSLPTLDTQPHRKNANANATKWGGNNSVGSFASAMLPTVRAGKHTSEDADSWQIRNDAGKVSTKPLALAVRLPTPIATDGRDRGNLSHPAIQRRVRLGKTVTLSMILTTPTADTSSPPTCADGPTAPIGGMKLTPEFLSWLMGYPPDWLRPLQDAPEMQSSRKRGDRLPEPSTNG